MALVDVTPFFLFRRPISTAMGALYHSVDCTTAGSASGQWKVDAALGTYAAVTQNASDYVDAADGATLTNTCVTLTNLGTLTEGYMTVVLPAPLNLTGKQMVVEFNLRTGTDGGTDDYKRIRGVEILLRSSGYAGQGRYYAANYGAYTNRPGWRRFSVDLATQNGQAVVSPQDLSAITQICITFQATASSTVAMDLGSIKFYNRPSKLGAVCINVDGGLLTSADYITIANTAGLPVSIGMNHSEVGDGTHFTAAQISGTSGLQSLAVGNKGTSYLSLTTRGNMYWSDKSFAQRICDCIENVAALTTLGFNAPRCGHVPGSAWYPDFACFFGNYVDSLTSFASPSLHIGGSNCTIPATWCDPAEQPFNVMLTPTLAGIQGLVDAAVASHGIIYITLDGQTAIPLTSSGGVDNWTDMCAYIKAAITANGMTAETGYSIAQFAPEATTKAATQAAQAVTTHAADGATLQTNRAQVLATDTAIKAAFTGTTFTGGTASTTGGDTSAQLAADVQSVKDAFNYPGTPNTASTTFAITFSDQSQLSIAMAAWEGNRNSLPDLTLVSASTTPWKYHGDLRSGQNTGIPLPIPIEDD